ncbi:hypothetical protein [Amphritea balenae]|uniref:Uncharacterized protein n=1 Tax=Amphritea balenae TaxID=452629 RepID=A0A3P1SKY1_9GAMM|nr:hypothetical protein [Amphritea balenae]RRC97579.1 hypothetical protein EHS89_17245 [Amphritea balenae]GGK73968.1 hypothetical protein GCM10007941_25020 [Amphritea balenae]
MDNLESRACQLAREFLGHAIKVRAENPEYAQSPEQSCFIVGMELGRLAQNADQQGKQDILNGLTKALQQLKLSEQESQTIYNTLAPQIMPADK